MLIFLLFFLPFLPISTIGSEVDLEYKVQALTDSLTATLRGEESRLTYRHIINAVTSDGETVELDDGILFSVHWRYRSIPKKWQRADRLYITFDRYFHSFKLEHATSKEVVWASIKQLPSTPPFIRFMPTEQKDPDCYSKITLSNKCIFKGCQERVFEQAEWKEKDRVLVFAGPQNQYQLWNLERNTFLPAILVAKRTRDLPINVECEELLNLETKLNEEVLQQTQAAKTISASMLLYAAGLKPKDKPVGIFLFLGPTGVGKTELCKALTRGIYKSETKLIRFDMSHFAEENSVSRLIGSPPGYVNHEEGGQLTERLKENPQVVVLLDEMEKAHRKVLRVFLPAFDEGYILDNKNRWIDCSNTIFVMTSNLCGPEISQYYREGYSNEEILATIEPILMRELSPELYNRVEPVLFHPLEKKTMESLVDLHLNRMVRSVKEEHEINIEIDDSLRDFLIWEGYHPLLGARPLKMLIEKKVIALLARSIIEEQVKKGDNILLYYAPESDLILISPKRC